MRRKPTWQPATEFKVTKLKRNGPKGDQTAAQWMQGKVKNDRFRKAEGVIDAVDHIAGNTEQR